MSYDGSGAEVVSVGIAMKTWSPASIIIGGSTQTCTGIPGVKANDYVIVVPPTGMLLNLFITQAARCTVDGQVSVQFGNVSLGGLLPPSGTWTFLYLRPTT